MKKITTLDWLTGTPASDANFKTALEDARLEELDQALEARGVARSKGAFTAILREIKNRLTESGMLESIAALPKFEDFSPEALAKKADEAKRVEAYQRGLAESGSTLADPEIRKQVLAEKMAPKNKRTITLHDLEVMPAVPSPAQDEWSNAKRFAQMAEGFSQASVVAQIMCGFELIELQKLACATRGGDRKSGSKPNDSVLIKWADIVKEKIGRSDDTARNWMNMARAVKPKLKKLDGPWEAPALLALPPSEWPEEARAAVQKTLHGICDGQTQAEFMAELGLAKKQHGHAIKNGNGGFHPNAIILRAWLAAEYPTQPELQELDFGDLPEEVQARFKKEGKRYEERLTKEEKAELERQAEAREWNGHAATAIGEALDKGFYGDADDEQLSAQENALKDYLAKIREQRAARASHAPKAKALAKH